MLYTITSKNGFFRRYDQVLRLYYGGRRHCGKIVVPNRVAAAYELVHKWYSIAPGLPQSMPCMAARFAYWKEIDLAPALEVAYLEGGPNAVRLLLEPPLDASADPS